MEGRGVVAESQTVGGDSSNMSKIRGGAVIYLSSYFIIPSSYPHSSSFSKHHEIRGIGVPTESQMATSKGGGGVSTIGLYFIIIKYLFSNDNNLLCVSTSQQHDFWAWKRTAWF